MRKVLISIINFYDEFSLQMSVLFIFSMTFIVFSSFSDIYAMTGVFFIVFCLLSIHIFQHHVVRQTISNMYMVDSFNSEFMAHLSVDHMTLRICCYGNFPITDQKVVKIIQEEINEYFKGVKEKFEKEQEKMDKTLLHPFSINSLDKNTREIIDRVSDRIIRERDEIMSV